MTDARTDVIHVGQPAGFSGEAAAELHRVAHDQVGRPVADDSEQVWRDRPGVDQDQDLRDRPFDVGHKGGRAGDRDLVPGRDSGLSDRDERLEMPVPVERRE
jgi:hypothetical protein